MNQRFHNKGMLQFPTAASGRPKIYGRSNELKRLRSIYDGIAKPRRRSDHESDDGLPFGSNGCIVHVTGLHGVGKSTLVREFIHLQSAQSQRGVRRGTSRGAGAKLPFTHAELCFDAAAVEREACPAEDAGSLGQFGEMCISLIDTAQSISRQIAEHQRETALSKGTWYAGRDDSDSDDTSISVDELFEDDSSSPQVPAVPACQVELDSILANSKGNVESLLDLFKYICKHVTSPFVMFLDDLNRADSVSNGALRAILETKLENCMIVCCGDQTDLPQAFRHVSVQTLRVHPLPLETITMFTADSIKKETHEASIVSKTVYAKTLGVMSYVIAALEEAVEKKVLHYDVEDEDWRWEIKMVDEVTDHVSLNNDVKDSVSGRLDELPQDIQRMMTFMSCLSADVHFQASLLVDVMETGGHPLDEGSINDHLEWATNEGFLTRSSPTAVRFAHPLVRQACQAFMPQEERESLTLQVFNHRFEKWNAQRPNGKWSKREMSFLAEFFHLLDSSGDSRRFGGTRRDNKLSKSMGPSMSLLSKKDGRDVRLSDVRKDGAPPETGKRRTGGRPGRRGSAGMLSKSMGAIAEIQNMEIVLEEKTDEVSDQEAKEVKKTTPSGMIELLSDKVTDQGTGSPKTTKQVLDYLFFPHVTDPKSWLLRHGSVFVGTSKSTEILNSIDNERELMFFTHGFVVADVAFQDIFRLFFALSDQEFLTEAALMDYVRAELRLNHPENELDEESVYECLYDLAIPKPKNLASSLCGDSDSIDPQQLQESLRVFVSDQRSSKLRWQGSAAATKVETAMLFSSIARVDSLNISHCGDPRSIEIHSSEQADSSLSVSLFEEDEPIHLTFAIPEERDVWISKFGDSVIQAWENSSDVDMLKKQTKIGWQHLVVRSSPTTFVILDDHNGLERCLNRDHTDLDMLDEYNGYSALHYATILGHTRCVDVLLRKGAAATLHDKNGLTPMIHAVALGHDEAADLIESYGSKRKDAVKLVEEDEELRKAAFKATSESLRSLELSDHNINDFHFSCPSRVSCPTVKRDADQPSSTRNISQPPSHRNNKNKKELTTPSILRGRHKKLSIPGTTSLEDFKLFTPSTYARRVVWADVRNKPESLRTIVTYPLSESEEEDDDNSSDDTIDVTSTSTTQETTQSEDEDGDEVAQNSPQIDSVKPTSISRSSLMPQHPQHRNQMSSTVGLSFLGRPNPLLQSLDSINSSESESASDSVSAEIAPVPATSSLVPQRSQRHNQMAATVGRSLIGRQYLSIQSLQSISTNLENGNNEDTTDLSEAVNSETTDSSSPLMPQRPRHHLQMTPSVGRSLQDLPSNPSLQPHQSISSCESESVSLEPQVTVDIGAIQRKPRIRRKPTPHFSLKTISSSESESLSVDLTQNMRKPTANFAFHIQPGSLVSTRHSSVTATHLAEKPTGNRRASATELGRTLLGRPR